MKGHTMQHAHTHWLFAAALTLGVAGLTLPASAQETGRKPLVLIMLDTSGKMEQHVTQDRLPVCSNDCYALPNPNTYEYSRSIAAKSVLTGTIPQYLPPDHENGGAPNYMCCYIDRSGQEPDPIYPDTHPEVPMHVYQVQNGILDTYVEQVRFAVMASDTNPAKNEGNDGGRSYGPSTTAGNKQWNIGGKNLKANRGFHGNNGLILKAAGALIPVPESEDPAVMREQNEILQEEIRWHLPHGWLTPTAAMLDDARYYYTTDKNIIDDPCYEHLSKHAILVVGAYPSFDKCYEDGVTLAETTPTPGAWDEDGDGTNDCDDWVTIEDQVDTTGNDTHWKYPWWYYQTSEIQAARLYDEAGVHTHVIGYYTDDATDAKLRAIAMAGKTCDDPEASDCYFVASDPDSLTMSFNLVMSKIFHMSDAGLGSKTKPATTSRTSFRNNEVGLYEMSASFDFIGTHWRGHLERITYTCQDPDNDGTFELYPDTVVDFADTLAAQNPDERRIFSSFRGTLSEVSPPTLETVLASEAFQQISGAACRTYELTASSDAEIVDPTDPSTLPALPVSTEDGVCGNGYCEPGEGETCLNCALDCASDTTSKIEASTCNNNGICEPGLGESCTTCPTECNQKTGGGAFCCGDDGTCNASNKCTDTSGSNNWRCNANVIPYDNTYCCGDNINDCALDARCSSNGNKCGTPSEDTSDDSGDDGTALCNTTCSADSDCGSTQGCFKGCCYSLRNECSQHSDCPSGEVCHLGGCDPGQIKACDLGDFLRGSDHPAGHPVLGDIIHSNPTIMVGPELDLPFPTYKQFRADWGGRDTLLFVGGNDGMMHAFTLGDLDASGDEGKERWAYVPRGVHNKLRSLVTGHGNYVDATPVVKDVRLYRALIDGEYKEKWITALVGGLRTGGRSYFALDVTDPDGPKFLWEHTASETDFDRLGYTYGEAAVGSVFVEIADQPKAEIAVAFLPGGVPSDPDSVTEGRAFYVVDMRTGTLIRKFTQFSNGNDIVDPITGAPVAHNTFAGTLATRVFVPDAKGRLLRLDTTSSNPADWTFDVFFDPEAKLGISDAGEAYFAPAIALNRLGQLVIVYGVGNVEDLEGRSKTSFVVSLTENFKLNLDDSVTATANLNWSKVFASGGNSTGEKLTGKPIIFNSVAYFPSFVPDSPEVCEYGWGRVYGVDFEASDNNGPKAVVDLDADGTEDVYADFAPATGIFGVEVAARPACITKKENPDGTYSYVGASSSKPQLILQTGNKPYADDVTPPETTTLPTIEQHADKVRIDIPKPPTTLTTTSWSIVYD